MLYAQQAALWHVVWHAAAPPTQESDANASERERAPLPELASLCAFDAAFGQVLGGGPATHHSVLSGTGVSQAALHRSRACIVAESLTPRSRGPPVLL